MSSERKVTVVMTASGRAKEHPAGADLREVLNAVYCEHMTAGSGWDRPTKLFVAGECVVADGLADIAWDYGKFQRQKEDEVEAALDEWVEQRFGRKAEGEAV